MLECLDIHAFKLIEDIHIDFKEGFSVITGETGAGKSIMLSALSLLLGGKTDSSAIRNGFESASVSGQFFIDNKDNDLKDFLKQNNIDCIDDTLIIKRIIKTNGRTLSYINNEAVNRAVLSQLSTYLIDISAQHAHQSIMQSSKQLTLLDNFGETHLILEEYKKIFQEVKDLEKEKLRIENIINSSRQQEDYLKYAFDEINSIDPKENEDELLSDNIRRISQFEQIHDNVSYVLEVLNNSYEGSSTINNLENCTQMLDKISQKDNSIGDLKDRMKSCVIEVEDIYETLKDYVENMQYSQVELDEMQSRLAQLQKIKKKYGPSLENVLIFKESIDSKLNALTNGQDDIIFIEKKLNKAKQELKVKAEQLSTERKKSALKLSSSIEKTLRKLGMIHASFAINFIKEDYHLAGFDSIEFLMSANPGIEKRSIKEIASGGELSRVMLAIKATLSEKDHVSTLVFDEIDAGIGGEVATNVAQSLQELATTSQVIAITHLASIASKANNHLLVKKYVSDGQSYTTIIELDSEKRISEISRMLSGDVNSKVSIDHAKSLLD